MERHRHRPRLPIFRRGLPSDLTARTTFCGTNGCVTRRGAVSQEMKGRRRRPSRLRVVGVSSCAASDWHTPAASPRHNPARPCRMSLPRFPRPEPLP